MIVRTQTVLPTSLAEREGQKKREGNVKSARSTVPLEGKARAGGAWHPGTRE